jgi:DNA phosphorothioation-associated putative methyltransferase
METPACPPSGKRVKGNLYFHVSVLATLDTPLRERVRLAAAQACLSSHADFNVIKIDETGQRISLLSYAHFFDHPFPVLQSAAVVNLASGRVKRIHYDPSQNPPILHRKELLLPRDHPQVPMFAALTRQLEAAGLFRDARRIGFLREWQGTRCGTINWCRCTTLRNPHLPPQKRSPGVPCGFST